MATPFFIVYNKITSCRGEQRLNSLVWFWVWTGLIRTFIMFQVNILSWYYSWSFLSHDIVLKGLFQLLRFIEQVSQVNFLSMFVCPRLRLNLCRIDYQEILTKAEVKKTRGPPWIFKEYSPNFSPNIHKGEVYMAENVFENKQY